VEFLSIQFLLIQAQLIQAQLIQAQLAQVHWIRIRQTQALVFENWWKWGLLGVLWFLRPVGFVRLQVLILGCHLEGQ
jgi:hypothetical protein